MISFQEGSSQVLAPTLRRGLRGTAVGDLQVLLLQIGFSLKQDGIFGVETETVVKQLQSAAGVTPDGIVGPITWNLIQRRLGKGFVVRGTADEYTPGEAKPLHEETIPVAVAAPSSNDTMWMIGAGILLVGGLVWFASRRKHGR